MKVKVCGITNLSDALDAVAFGATALGFVFDNDDYSITVGEVRNIVMQLPPFISTVGVFSNEEAEYINHIADECDLDFIQLRGNESPGFCKTINKKVIKNINLLGEEDLETVGKYTLSVNALLLDVTDGAVREQQHKTFSWGLAASARRYNIPVLLAADIPVDTLTQAVRTAKPYALDVCRTYEVYPGKKDYQKLSELFRIISQL